MPKRKFPSQYLTVKEAEGVIRAAVFAACVGFRLNRFVTINAKVAQVQAGTQGEFFTRVLKHFHDLQRQLDSDYVPLHVGTVEAVGGLHLHFLVRVHHDHTRGLQRRFEQWVNQSGGVAAPKVVEIRRLNGWQNKHPLSYYFVKGLHDTVTYMVKGVDPRFYDRFSIPQKHRVPQGPVTTKRTLIAVGVHRNARATVLVKELWSRQLHSKPYSYVPRPIHTRLQSLTKSPLLSEWIEGDLRG